MHVDSTSHAYWFNPSMNFVKYFKPSCQIFSHKQFHQHKPKDEFKRKVQPEQYSPNVCAFLLLPYSLLLNLLNDIKSWQITLLHWSNTHGVKTNIWRLQSIININPKMNLRGKFSQNNIQPTFVHFFDFHTLCYLTFWMMCKVDKLNLCIEPTHMG